MTRISDPRSIIGIDPSSRGLAFIVFESGTLLDWGTRRKDGQESHLLDDLFQRYKTDVLLLEDPDAERCERRPKMRRLLRLVREHAAKKNVTVITISRHDIRRAWTERGVTNKHGVARALTTMFPELEPLTPRMRKPYRSEQARTDIYDALSLVLHTFDVEPGFVG